MYNIFNFHIFFFSGFKHDVVRSILPVSQLQTQQMMTSQIRSQYI